MAIRRPTFRKQLGDPTTLLDPYICTLESGAMGLDVQTDGRISIWGGQLVRWCGRTVTDIKRKGTNLYNVRTAWAHFGQTLIIKNGYTWATLRADLAALRWVILQGDYDQFSLATRCQDSFLGNHAIIVSPIVNSDGRRLIGDPLCKDFHWVWESELRRYAEDLGKQVYRAAGKRWTGQILFAVTKKVASTSVPTVKYNAVVHPTPPATRKAFFVYNLRSGVIVGRTTAYTGGFSATCTAPYSFRYPLVSKSYSLVRLTSGSRSGHYISAEFAHKA